MTRTIRHRIEVRDHRGVLIASKQAPTLSLEGDVPAGFELPRSAVLTVDGKKREVEYLLPLDGDELGVCVIPITVGERTKREAWQGLRATMPSPDGGERTAIL